MAVGGSGISGQCAYSLNCSRLGIYLFICSAILGAVFHCYAYSSRRFDRTEDGKRIHFASAMTLLGLNDGDNATTGHGYIDIVDFIISGCTDVDANLRDVVDKKFFLFQNFKFICLPTVNFY